MPQFFKSSGDLGVFKPLARQDPASVALNLAVLLLGLDRKRQSKHMLDTLNTASVTSPLDQLAAALKRTLRACATRR
jgi:hypothetical protein